MPYKDKESQREYNREYQRLRRAGVNGNGSTSKSKTRSQSCQPPPLFTTPYRIEKAKDLLRILEDAINSVREDDMITSLQRARTLGYLVSIGIRVLETSNLEARIESLEQVLKSRNRKENVNKCTNTTKRRGFEHT